MLRNPKNSTVREGYTVDGHTTTKPNQLAEAMTGIQIRDREGRNGHQFLSFDVRDLLNLMKGKVNGSYWKCSGLECMGENAPLVHAVEDAKRSIPTSEFADLMDGVYQTIDGLFEAYQEGERKPWLIIEAIDSSYFEVWCDDPALIEILRAHFVDTSEISLDR